MLVDHVNSVILPALLHKNYFILSGFGRIAYPFFMLSFLLTLQEPEEDYKKRFKKILLWSFIAWPAHYLCFHSFELDILFVFAAVLIIRKLDFTFNQKNQAIKNTASQMLFKTISALCVLFFVALTTPNHNYGWAGLIVFLSGVCLVTYRSSFIAWIGLIIGLITLNFVEDSSHPLFNNTLYMVGILKYEILFLAGALGFTFLLNEMLPDKRWLPRSIALPFYAMHLYIIGIITEIIKYYHP